MDELDLRHLRRRNRELASHLDIVHGLTERFFDQQEAAVYAAEFRAQAAEKKLRQVQVVSSAVRYAELRAERAEMRMRFSYMLVAFMVCVAAHAWFVTLI
jgi:hypothetical protein